MAQGQVIGVDRRGSRSQRPIGIGIRRIGKFVFTMSIECSLACVFFCYALLFRIRSTSKLNCGLIEVNNDSWSASFDRNERNWHSFFSGRMKIQAIYCSFHRKVASKTDAGTSKR